MEPHREQQMNVAPIPDWLTKLEQLRADCTLYASAWSSWRIARHSAKRNYVLAL